LFSAMNAGGSADPTVPIRFLAHLPNFVKLYARLWKDKRVPLFPKALIVAAAVYVISPLDLSVVLPIPVISSIDDVGIVILALRAFIPLCPKNVVAEHVQLIDEGK